ncbi:TatD family hydrolase [Pedobacter sandarakinus]|uniref:TatD family hydrolase n=1 Tax=Pedobacter sandarakinus TaxID=353156 RepID=UPI0022453D65|nr:TatD family hydrolase [Pedobacter sandarakinus]MCX2576138.1 TatD family hydrolase [Pedobacter sandarakinus]
MDFLDLHTHKANQKTGVFSIQSLSLTSDIFLAMPKTRLISIGLHPWYATFQQTDLQMRYLEVLAKQSNVKLIGECGLDRLKGDSLDNQIIIFEMQIKLAMRFGKAVIIHCVKAFSELIEIKQRMRVDVPMIIHGFNKSEILGRQLLAKGFYLSFGAAILDPDSNPAVLLRKTDFFFLETDDADIEIEDIYLAAANLKNCSVDELKARIFANWKKLNLI